MVTPPADSAVARAESDPARAVYLSVLMRAVVVLATLVVVSVGAVWLGTRDTEPPSVRSQAAPATPVLTLPCARRVMEDWYDNSRVDRMYAIPCYTEALKLLPDDGFGPDPTARDEITRALQYARGRVED